MVLIANLDNIYTLCYHFLLKMLILILKYQIINIITP